MSVRLGSAGSDPSGSGHHLLGGWRDVVEDVRRLSSELRRAPGTCTCGHTASQPGGTCPCCQSGTPRTDCVDCVALVNALGGRLDTLIDDTLRFLPVLADILRGRAATDESEHLKLVRRQIGVVDGAFRRLATASTEFRRGCSASEMTAVTAVADDLLRETWTLEEMLEPGTRRWPELGDPA